MGDRRDNPHANAASDAGKIAARLARLVEEQRDAFRDLARLSESQASMIEGDDADGLLRVLTERQGVVDRIASLGEELAPFNDRWDELLPRVPDADRERIGGAVQELHELARQVEERDRADRDSLERRRNAMVDQLAGVAKGRGAINAYRSRTSNSPRYQDRQG